MAAVASVDGFRFYDIFTNINIDWITWVFAHVYDRILPRDGDDLQIFHFNNNRMTLYDIKRLHRVYRFGGKEKKV